MRRAVARAPLASHARHHSTLQQRVRSGDSEMYLCGSLLPSRARASFFATRALNIEVAGVRDAVRGNAPMGRVRMAFWRDLIGAACEAAPLGGSGSSGGGGGGGAQLAAHPLFAPLRDAVAAHGHTRRWLERLVDAREADLEGRAPATVAAMETYFEATQGSLLYLTLEALGVREAGADRAASHVGRAVGISTLLRSLAVHARLGQQYLPLDLLSKHGLSAADLEVRPEQVVTADGRPFFPAAAAPLQPPPPLPQPSAAAAAAPSTLRMAESPAAARQRAAGGQQPQQQQPTLQQQRSSSDAAAAAGLAALPSASAGALFLVRPPRVREALAGVVFDLACQAREHLRHARALAGALPPAAHAALLPAVPVAAFLARLEQQNFDALATGGLGPWQDGRPHARLLLLGSLMWHTARNSY